MKIVIGIVFMSLISCSFKRNEESKLDNKDSIEVDEKITIDTCSFCSLNPFLVKSSGINTRPKVVIDYSVAIEFFNRFKFVNKRFNDWRKNDTLKWNATLFHEMQNLQEQHAYYTQGIRPEILKRAVTILDTLTTGQFIKLTSHASTFVIDLRSYEQTDGVLMYIPGKQQIFWTMKKDEDHCVGYYGISKWYYSCH